MIFFRPLIMRARSFTPASCNTGFTLRTPSSRSGGRRKATRARYRRRAARAIASWTTSRTPCGLRTVRRARLAHPCGLIAHARSGYQHAADESRGGCIHHSDAQQSTSRVRQGSEGGRRRCGAARELEERDDGRHAGTVAPDSRRWRQRVWQTEVARGAQGWLQERRGATRVQVVATCASRSRGAYLRYRVLGVVSSLTSTPPHRLHVERCATGRKAREPDQSQGCRR